MILIIILLFSICLSGFDRLPLPEVYVSSICGDITRNEIWTGTYNGIYVLKKNTPVAFYGGVRFQSGVNTVTTSEAGLLDSRFVTALNLDEKYCFAGTDRSLEIIERESGKLVKKYPVSQVNDFLRLGKYLFAATYSGVYCIDSDDLLLKPASTVRQSLAELDNIPVSNLEYQPETRSLWALISTGGCLRISKNETRRFLSNVKILNIASFSERICFVAEDSLLVYNGYAWQRIRPNPYGNLPCRKIYSVHGSGKELFLSTENGMYIFDGNTFTPVFSTEDNHQELFVKSLFLDGRQLFLGSSWQGLFLHKI